jgi:hypothetical protein
MSRPLVEICGDVRSGKVTARSRVEAYLAEIARRTGGQVLDTQSLAGLAEILPRRARETDESVLRALWDTPAALTLLLVLLGLEWIGRRLLRLV